MKPIVIHYRCQQQLLTRARYDALQASIHVGPFSLSTYSIDRGSSGGPEPGPGESGCETMCSQIVMGVEKGFRQSRTY